VTCPRRSLCWCKIKSPPTNMDGVVSTEPSPAASAPDISIPSARPKAGRHRLSSHPDHPKSTIGSRDPKTLWMTRSDCRWLIFTVWCWVKTNLGLRNPMLRLKNGIEIFQDVDDFGIAPSVLRAKSEYSGAKSAKKRERVYFQEGPIPGDPVLQKILEPAK
ncbi:unnamed protein product, partial [Nesidiocoris tenuis]